MQGTQDSVTNYFSFIFRVLQVMDFTCRKKKEKKILNEIEMGGFHDE